MAALGSDRVFAGPAVRPCATQLIQRLINRTNAVGVFAFGRGYFLLMVYSFLRRAQKTVHKRSASTMLPQAIKQQMHLFPCSNQEV